MVDHELLSILLFSWPSTTNVSQRINIIFVPTWQVCSPSQSTWLICKGLNLLFLFHPSIFNLVSGHLWIFNEHTIKIHWCNDLNWAWYQYQNCEDYGNINTTPPTKATFVESTQLHNNNSCNQRGRGKKPIYNSSMSPLLIFNSPVMAPPLAIINRNFI